jgi:predicted RNA-binding Zn ribbon-like protein
MHFMDAARPPHRGSTLERYFQAARARQRLNWKQSPRLEWDVAGPSSRPCDLPLWALALSASHLMTSEAVHRVLRLLQPGVPLAFFGYQQEPYPEMVRYEAVREPDEGSQV